MALGQRATTITLIFNASKEMNNHDACANEDGNCDSRKHWLVFSTNNIVMYVTSRY